jgi:PKD repeat protein
MVWLTLSSTRAKVARLAALALFPAFGLSYRLAADVVIPSSAFASGRNAAEFHSDVRVFNPSTSPVIFTPVFYDQSSSETITKAAVTLPGRSQVAYDNVLSSLFGRSVGSFGPIRFQTSSPLVVSSSVNNVNGCGNGSVSGQWLPGIDVQGALKAGTLVQLAVSADGSQGYRTNVDFINPGSAAANVTVKVRKGDGSQLSSATLAPIGPNGFFQRTLDDGGTFPGVAGTTDTNLWVEFTSDQPVLAFASVISNASGDPFAIVMTPEIVPAPVAPVASYSVSPASPKTGESVTFTDTSTGNPTTQFWDFGDGSNSTTSATVSHTYGAAATYKTAHAVTNAAGISAATKDVVVAAPEPAGPTDVTITAYTWAYDPPLTTLKVGTTYRITFKTRDVTHGAALAALGLQDCGTITPGTPCVRTFTPSASQVDTFTFYCLQPSCGLGHETMTGQIKIER